MNVEGFPGISGIGITATVARTGMGRTIDAMLGAVAHLDVAQVVSGHLPNLPDGWPLAGGFTGKIDAALEVPGLHFLEGVLQSNTGLAESVGAWSRLYFDWFAADSRCLKRSAWPVRSLWKAGLISRSCRRLLAARRSSR